MTQQLSTFALDQKKDKAAQETKLTQLDAWLHGHSIHKKIDGNEYCCPDMSCCVPEVQAPMAFRKLYIKAFKNDNDKLKQALLDTFNMYYCKTVGFNTAAGGRYYTEWLMQDQELFTVRQRLATKVFMRLHGIEY